MTGLDETSGAQRTGRSTKSFHLRRRRIATVTTRDEIGDGSPAPPLIARQLIEDEALHAAETATHKRCGRTYHYNA